VTAQSWTPVPTRACAPWCEQGEQGHWDAHPDDRSCWSEFRNIDMTLAAPEKLGDGQWVLDRMEVCLRRRPDAADAHLMLHHEGTDAEFEFTLDEARQLRAALDELLPSLDYEHSG
jgi:hypothetical protein